MSISDDSADKHSMNLLDALELLKQPISEPAPVSDRELFLACGFTPLHLKTFLAAQLRLCFPRDHIEIRTGLYGDLVGNLERLQPISWIDGLRRGRMGGSRPSAGHSVTRRMAFSGHPRHCGLGPPAKRAAVHIIKQLADKVPIYVSIPTLPLPPIFTTRGGQAHHYECQLRDIVASLATSISAQSG